MIDRYFGKIKVETDHPHPLESPDYYNPAGSIEDNHSNSYFIWEIDTHFQGSPYALLDLGCAGGQFVVDIASKGYPWLAVGLEGGNVLGMTESFDPDKTACGKLTRARGASNWENYKDICLFHADVSKPFKIVADTAATKEIRKSMHVSQDPYLDDGDDVVKFNIVTAFEFFEHPLPEEIPGILKNANKHMRIGSIFVGTINLSSGEHHRCAKPVSWWKNIFEEHGFSIPEDNKSIWVPLGPNGGKRGVYKYPFRTTYRTNIILPPPTPQKFIYDQETQPNEGNFPFMVVKTRECEE